MAVQVAQNNLSVPFVRSGDSFSDDNGVIEQDGGRAAVLKNLTVMAKKLSTLAVVGVADIGNTGDGTVTAVAKLADGKVLLIGDYKLEATGVGVDGRVPGATTPDGGNTGNGTVTALAIIAGELPLVGDWILTCTDPNAGGTATAGAVTAGGGDTGNGAPGALTLAAEVVEGTYTLTCIEAIVNAGRFEVADPNGNRLEDLNIAVAYSNTHFAITIADGAADFIVGDSFTFVVTIEHGGLFTLADPDGVNVREDIILPGGAGGTVAVVSGGIGFTITDGATDFDADDFFTLEIAAAEGGVWELEDPLGNVIVAGLTMGGAPLGATIFYEGGITFTITDGAADFIVGDIFLITVTEVGKYIPLDPAALDGSQLFAGIYLGEEITAAALIAGDIATSPMLVGSNCTIDEDQLVFENAAALTTLQSDGKTIEQAMASYGIFAEATIDIDEYENA